MYTCVGFDLVWLLLLLLLLFFWIGMASNMIWFVNFFYWGRVVIEKDIVFVV
jgi:hypothetical protein